jgi:hypothetical protein
VEAQFNQNPSPHAKSQNESRHHLLLGNSADIVVLRTNQERQPDVQKQNLNGAGDTHTLEDYRNLQGLRWTSDWCSSSRYKCCNLVIPTKTHAKLKRSAHAPRQKPKKLNPKKTYFKPKINLILS